MWRIKRKLRSWEILAVGTAAGLACGTLAVLSMKGSLKGNILQNCTQYPLLNQSLDCQTLNSSTERLTELDHAVDTAVPQYLQAGKATHVSVYERDLVTNQWGETNGNDQFAPASLMKLPLMIAYYKVAELDPSLLSVSLTYEPSSALNDSSQDFIPQSTLTPGAQYTVETLIEKMIIDSDNNATAMLLAHLDPNLFNKTLVDLGIEIPQSTSTINFVSAKSYANIFRMLYNASYLNQSDSQKALNLLSRSTFTQGLPSSIPPSITIAHKFGEREVDAPDGSPMMRELHDCGIVYKHPDPYVVCIMTSGTNWNDLLSVVHDISALVYQNI